jgi:uncharacterized protein (DUF1697 family)
MTYAALIRGINVGGRNIITMNRLTACFERSGFERVATVIQSGNVVFESDVKSSRALEQTLEAALTTMLARPSTVVVRSLPELRRTLGQVPTEWNTRTDLRCNIAFVRAPLTAAQVAAVLEPRAGVDFVTRGTGAVFMATLLRDVKKSGLPKLITKDVYRSVTVRNYSSTRRILALMEAR